MKKLFLSILLMMFISMSLFAKTKEQKVVEIDLDYSFRTCSVENAMPYLEKFIQSGWTIHSITPITTKRDRGSLTQYLIVVLEKEND